MQTLLESAVNVLLVGMFTTVTKTCFQMFNRCNQPEGGNIAGAVIIFIIWVIMPFLILAYQLIKHKIAGTLDATVKTDPQFRIMYGWALKKYRKPEHHTKLDVWVVKYFCCLIDCILFRNCADEGTQRCCSNFTIFLTKNAYLWEVINALIKIWVVAGQELFNSQGRQIVHAVVITISLLLHLFGRPFKDDWSNIVAILFCIADMFGIFAGTDPVLQISFIVLFVLTLLIVFIIAVVSFVRMEDSSIDDEITDYSEMEKKLLYPIILILRLSEICQGEKEAEDEDANGTNSASVEGFKPPPPSLDLPGAPKMLASESEEEKKTDSIDKEFDKDFKPPPPAMDLPGAPSMEMIGAPKISSTIETKTTERTRRLSNVMKARRRNSAKSVSEGECQKNKTDKKIDKELQPPPPPPPSMEMPGASGTAPIDMADWDAVQEDNTDQVYYYNSKTGQSSWSWPPVGDEVPEEEEEESEGENVPQTKKRLSHANPIYRQQRGNEEAAADTMVVDSMIDSIQLEYFRSEHKPDEPISKNSAWQEGCGKVCSGHFGMKWSQQPFRWSITSLALLNFCLDYGLFCFLIVMLYMYDEWTYFELDELTFVLCMHAFFFAAVANIMVLVIAVPYFDHFLRWLTMLLLPTMIVGFPFILVPLIYALAIYGACQGLAVVIGCIFYRGSPEEEDVESLLGHLFAVFGGLAVLTLSVLTVLWPTIYSASIPSPDITSSDITSSNITSSNITSSNFTSSSSTDIMLFCSFLPPIVLWPKIVYFLVLIDNGDSDEQEEQEEQNDNGVPDVAIDDSEFGDNGDRVGGDDDDDNLKVRFVWDRNDFIAGHMYKRGHLTGAMILPLVLPVGIPLIILAARGWI